jgi:hypothetical protein
MKFSVHHLVLLLILIESALVAVAAKHATSPTTNLIKKNLAIGSLDSSNPTRHLSSAPLTAPTPGPRRLKSPLLGSKKTSKDTSAAIDINRSTNMFKLQTILKNAKSGNKFSLPTKSVGLLIKYCQPRFFDYIEKSKSKSKSRKPRKVTKPKKARGFNFFLNPIQEALAVPTKAETKAISLAKKSTNKIWAKYQAIVKKFKSKPATLKTASKLPIEWLLRIVNSSKISSVKTYANYTISKIRESVSWATFRSVTPFKSKFELIELESRLKLSTES